MMRNYSSLNKLKTLTYILAIFLFAASSCEYKEIADAPFPEETVYLSTAALVKRGADANGLYANGVYRIINVDVPNQVPRYNIDLAGSKFNLLMGVLRGGVTSEGVVNVNLALNTDTIALLKTSGVLTSTTELLPVDRITIPSSVQIADNSNSSAFNFGIDLAFLKNNPNKTYAICLTINSNDRTVTSNLQSLVILINTAIFQPTANFTSSLNAATKTVTLTNSSLNWLNYTWDFGDGSPTVTTDLAVTNNNNRVLPAITKTFAASGTYVVKLTAVGLPVENGQVNQSVRTVTIVVP